MNPPKRPGLRNIHLQAAARPLTPAELQWVLPRLTEAPEGARRPVDWLFLLVWGIQLVFILFYLFSAGGYYGQHAGRWAVVVVAAAALWYVKEMVVLLFQQGESPSTPGNDSEPVALEMEGPCERTDDGGVPLFHGLPCLLPPGWDDRFPIGTSTLEVVPGRDAQGPLESSSPIGDGRFWVVVGMGERDRLDADLGRGLPTARPGTIRRRILTAATLGLALLALGFSGPTWGFQAWDDFAGPRAEPAELRTSADLDRADLGPGREIILMDPFALADGPRPPHGDPDLVPVAMAPSAEARRTYDAILDSIAHRIEARERWFGGDLEAEREIRLQRLLAGPDASMAGNQTWDDIQSELWRFLRDDGWMEPGLLAKLRLNIARQAINPGVLHAARTWEKPILDTLVAQAVDALQAGARPMWIRGLEPQRQWHEEIDVTDSFPDVVRKIQSRFPTTPPVFAVLAERTAKGWIAIEGGRGLVTSWLVAGWIGLSALAIAWNLLSSLLLARRHSAHLRRMASD